MNIYETCPRLESEKSTKRYLPPKGIDAIERFSVSSLIKWSCTLAKIMPKAPLVIIFAHHPLRFLLSF